MIASVSLVPRPISSISMLQCLLLSLCLTLNPLKREGLHRLTDLFSHVCASIVEKDQDLGTRLGLHCWDETTGPRDLP